MAVDVREQAFAVQPEAAHGPAAVALPGGRFVRGRAGEQQGAALSVEVGDGDVGDRAPGEPPAGAAVGGEAVGPGEVRERLVVGGDGEDLGGVGGVGGPAADPGVGRAPVGEPAGRAAVDRGEVDLGVQGAPGRVGDGGAVGREAGMADPGPVDGHPARPGPVGGPPGRGGRPTGRPRPRSRACPGGGAGTGDTRRRHSPPNASRAKGPGQLVVQPTSETISFRWATGVRFRCTKQFRSMLSGTAERNC
ncbi:hypothetical protein SMICM304S_09062 [Streptomyces microflavus]